MPAVSEAVSAAPQVSPSQATEKPASTLVAVPAATSAATAAQVPATACSRRAAAGSDVPLQLSAAAVTPAAAPPPAATSAPSSVGCTLPALLESAEQVMAGSALGVWEGAGGASVCVREGGGGGRVGGCIPSGASALAEARSGFRRGAAARRDARWREATAVGGTQQSVRADILTAGRRPRSAAARR